MTRDTHYPGYDVLDKRDSPSWDDATRVVIDARLNTAPEPAFFSSEEWAAVMALCDCVMPRAARPPVVPLAAMLDDKLAHGPGDGYRDARLPPRDEAWHRGLAALDAESVARGGAPFARLPANAQHDMVERMARGELVAREWKRMPSAVFFSKRVLHDITSSYYAHPQSWSEMGFGGPANPRGYVRLIESRRDPWEPTESTERDDADRRARVTKENRRVR
ncbi:gluconate 2-dehydrogenase gamma chain (plasmid) [Pararobbsia alpina]|uniref:gluconate 2-dehydrogenase subunit 3 family protein n=1 Tax=Pararobbsia alpina TaxID=621374 RepID=UPI0039A42191